MPAPPPGGGGAATAPAYTMSVGGSAIDLARYRVQPISLDLYKKDAWCEFKWQVVTSGNAPPGTADPFLGKVVEFTIDCGTGNGAIKRFHGSCERGAEWTFHADIGWVGVYTAYDYRWLGDLVPHTDAITTIDQSQFNLAPDDPDAIYIESRLGRTAGQIIQAVLDMPANITALAALGIGGYVGTGYGAGVTATTSGGAVNGLVIVDGGSGYTTGVNVLLYGGGGHGATAAVTSVDSNGVILAMSYSGGSGYASPPSVVVSNLAPATIADLAAINHLIPFPVTVQGEKLLEAVEGQLRSLAPNHMMWVRPMDGVIRFLDMRAFALPLVQFNDATGAGAYCTAVVAAGVVTGFTGLVGGANYSSAATVLVLGAGGSGATASCVVSGGVVTSVSLSSGGSGYNSPLTLALDRLDGVGYGAAGYAAGRAVDLASLSWTRSTEHCFTRVVGRGQPWTDGVWVGTAPAPGMAAGTNNGLVEDFAHDGLTDTQAKAAWNWYQFNAPDGSAGQAIVATSLSSGGVIFTLQYGGYGYGATPGIHLSGGSGGTGASCTIGLSGGAVVITAQSPGSGYTAPVSAAVDMPSGPGGDAGSCTCPSYTSITVAPTDPHKVWAANFWDQSASGRGGIVFLVDTSTTGLQTRIQARVIANTALAAGGTSTLTLDTAMPALSYTSYALVGLKGTASQVYRSYSIVDPAIAQHMAPRFNYPMGVNTSAGNAATLVSQPFCRGLWSSTGLAPLFEIPIPATFDPTSGTILTALPTVRYFGTLSKLELGGANVDGVLTDLQAFLAIYKGTLTATVPPDTSGPTQHFAGTASTSRGINRTLTVTIPAWRDPGQASGILQYVAQLLDTVKDEMHDLSFDVIGLYEEAWDAGVAINVAGSTYATGMDALNLPVVGVTLRWPDKGSRPRTQVQASNRRAQFTAEGYATAPHARGLLIGGPAEGFGAIGPAFGEGPGELASGSLGAFSGVAGDSFGGFGGAASGAFGAFGPGGPGGPGDGEAGGGDG